ncbi:MAG TPA: hypothetical protein VJ728_05390 [Candidatus Binataceae bacterium]|nr:hypothetical protein [Candidatus Binataceae bacterium]
MLSDNALRVGRISQGLLTLIRQGPKSRTLIDIADVIDSALLVSAQMSESRIDIEKMIEPSLPQVSGDSTALEEVIINLLLNAKEAMSGRRADSNHRSAYPGPC